MHYEKVTENKQGLLILTTAVLQLIKASNSFNHDQMFKQEIRLLLYHRNRQSELLNKLHELFLLRLNALSACEQYPSSALESKETEAVQSYAEKSLTGLLDLTDNVALPQEECLLTMERLREKLIPAYPKGEAELTTGNPPDIMHEVVPATKNDVKERTKSVISPILHWTKNDSKKTTRKKRKKLDSNIHIQIGSKTYTGFL